MDLDDVTGNPAWYILMGVGYAAFAFMIIILRGMGQSSIMPLWVKIVTILIIPIAAALFAGFAEG